MSGNSSHAPTSQLKTWTGRFGNGYVDRNEYVEWKMTPGTEAFRRILGGLKIQSVLEVGSNIGLNLLFINALFKGDVRLYAVEPNRKAFDRLMSQGRMKLEKAWNCNGFQLPLSDSSIDLVFTAGVLIHVAPDDLGRITDEIVRVARKYVLCREYFSHAPVEIPYYGQTGMLFKRDFGAFYLDRFPSLKCIRYGFLWQREFAIFDNSNWWLFEK
ncbi:MAG: methyltransferase domain-containing protein [Deltaproteobacteria bacterium]|nr:methyltransferase domain-containing protein [Deltaproteobacteria bacterium]